MYCASWGQGEVASLAELVWQTFQGQEIVILYRILPLERGPVCIFCLGNQDALGCSDLQVFLVLLAKHWFCLPPESSL